MDQSRGALRFFFVDNNGDLDLRRRDESHVDPLSRERDRRLLSAYAAFRRGAADSAEALYRGLLRDYPDDLEAQFQLADLLYQYNPLRGRPRPEARELFDAVLAYDPGFL